MFRTAHTLGCILVLSVVAVLVTPGLSQAQRGGRGGGGRGGHYSGAHVGGYHGAGHVGGYHAGAYHSGYHYGDGRYYGGYRYPPQTMVPMATILTSTTRIRPTILGTPVLTARRSLPTHAVLGHVSVVLPTADGDPVGHQRPRHRDSARRRRNLV